MDFCIRWFELPHFCDYSALDTCSYWLLNSLIRTTPFRSLLSTGHLLIWTFLFADSNCLISVYTQNWHMLIWSFAIADSICSISVNTQHWTRAHMEFCIRWFGFLYFGVYSALDTCSYGLLHSLIRISLFRCLLSTGHVLIWNFAFADSNCSISVTNHHWTIVHMDFCIRWFELLQFGDYPAVDTCSYGFCIRWFELLHFDDY
jgi:hypothetical protein